MAKRNTTKAALSGLETLIERTVAKQLGKATQPRRPEDLNRAMADEALEAGGSLAADEEGGTATAMADDDERADEGADERGTDGLVDARARIRDAADTQRRPTVRAGQTAAAAEHERWKRVNVKRIGQGYQYRQYYLGRSRASKFSTVIQERMPMTVVDRLNAGDHRPYERTINWLRALFADDKAEMRKWSGEVQLRTLGEATESAGGGLVPLEFAQDIIGKMGEMTPLANRDFLRVVPMNSDRIVVPALSTLPVAVYGTENTPPSGTTDPAWKQIELVAREAVLLVPVSMYLIDDATVDLLQYLTDLFADALARLRNRKLLLGSGSSEPEGILTNASVTTTSYVTTDGGTKFDSVVNAYHGIRPRYRDGAVWVMSDVALQTLSEIKDANKQPLLNQLADEPFPRLRGKPVFVTEVIDSATPARAVFGNWQYYLFGDRMNMVADTDRGGKYFESRQVAVRIIERYDGRVGQAEAFNVLTGIQ